MNRIKILNIIFILIILIGLVFINSCSSKEPSKDDSKRGEQRTTIINTNTPPPAAQPKLCSNEELCASGGECDDPRTTGIDIIYGQEKTESNPGCTFQPQLTGCQCNPPTDRLCKLVDPDNMKWYCR